MADIDKYIIKPELNLKNIIAESREVAQALNEFVDDLERIEKKYADIFCEEQEEEKMEPTNKQEKTKLPETPITDALLVNDYNRLVKENERLKDDYRAACRRNIENIDKIKKLENYHEKAIDNWTANWQKERDERIRLEKENKELGLKMKNLSYKLNEKEGECQVLKNDFEGLRKSLGAKTCEQCDKYKALKDYDILVGQYNTVCEKNKNLHKNMRDLNDENEKLRSTIDKFREQNTRFAKEIYELKKENDELKEHDNLLDSENKHLREDIMRLKDQLLEVAPLKRVKFIKERLGSKAGWGRLETDKTEAPIYSRPYILDEAKRCVCGQREQDYGTPESNFQLIADLWNGYLFPSLKENKEVISPMDVAIMMALLKIARIRNGGGSGDSFVDLAGYAACGGEIWYDRREKEKTGKTEE